MDSLRLRRSGGTILFDGKDLILALAAISGVAVRDNAAPASVYSTTIHVVT
jgi:hypothetical protein